MKQAIGVLLVIGLLSGCGAAAGGGSSSAANLMSSSVMLQKATYTGVGKITTSPVGGSNFTMAITDPPNLGGFSATNAYNATLLSGSTQNAGSFFIRFQMDPITICYAYKFDPNTDTLYLSESTTSRDPQTSCNAVVDPATESAYLVQTMG